MPEHRIADGTLDGDAELQEPETPNGYKGTLLVPLEEPLNYIGTLIKEPL